MRHSKKREAILDAVRSTRSHPDAEWVYGKVRETVPGISLGTVYRNLRELDANGELTTVETDMGSMRFDADTSPHAHFVCRECGSVSDLFGYGDIADKLRHVGYKVDEVKTVIYGKCPDCARKRGGDNGLS